MNIGEVEDILGYCQLLGMLAPQHVFLTDEQVGATNGAVSYRGLSPRHKRGTIFLSGAANFSTVPHEVLHSAFGMGEVGAYPLGFLIGLKAQAKKRMGRTGFLFAKKPRYQEVEAPPGYGGRVKHYVRVE